MKIINILIAVLCLTSFQLVAQEETEKEKRRIQITVGEDDEIDSNDHDDHDHDHDDYCDDDDRRTKMRFGMVDLGISTYFHEGSGLNMPNELSDLDQRLGRSINLGIHIVDLKLGLNGKNKPQYLGVSTGLRLNVATYSFENDFQLEEQKETFNEAIVEATRDIDKHRLRANYVMIPAMIEINTNPENPSKSFNLAFGYVHNLLLNSNHKAKFSGGGKSKVKDDFNLNKSYGMVEARIGYGPLNFYAQYGLAGLFQKDNGPDVTPINFGVNIIPR